VRDAIGSLPAPGASGDPLHDLAEARSDRVRRLIAAVPADGGSRKDLDAEFTLPCHARLRGFFDVYGRMRWSEVAPTITGGCVNPSKGRFLHPDQDRAITLREAALLQSFPADYAFSMRRGKYAAAALIGNALPPEFIRRQGEAVRDLLGAPVPARG
jgi:DNA (cytosine-5)-methyltransferase 1